MKAEKIINLLSKLKDKIMIKEKITVAWRNQKFELQKSIVYKDAYEGENEINTITVSLLDELDDDMTLVDKLQYAIDMGRCEVKFKGRFKCDYRDELREEKLKVSA